MTDDHEPKPRALADFPLAPDRTGTGLLNRIESVRVRSAGRSGHKLCWRSTGLLSRRAGFESPVTHRHDNEMLGDR